MRRTELREALSTAVSALRFNAFRSLLATLGIAIGALFVSLMGWLLYGLDTALERTITLLGQDMLYVDKWDWSGRTRWAEVRSRKDITLQQARALAQELQTAQIVAPLIEAYGVRLSTGASTATVTVTGTVSAYGLTPAGTVALGRFFAPVEDRSNTPVVVLGHAVARQLFPTTHPLGQTIRLAGHPFTVIGVLVQQGTIFTQEIDKRVYIPLPLFIRLFGAANRSVTIAVKAGSEERMEQLRQELRGLMRRIRRLAPEAPDDFSINEIQAIREEITGLRQAVWGIGLGMSMLSFVVGIIGIVNIMFVSVAERTLEIGIRKAVGARRRSIALQFLIEAALLCLAGATIAVVLGNAIAALTRTVVPQAEFLPPYIPLYHIGIALALASTAGIIAGWVPALRAARLHPVEALRYE